MINPQWKKTLILVSLLASLAACGGGGGGGGTAATPTPAVNPTPEVNPTPVVNSTPAVSPTPSVTSTPAPVASVRGIQGFAYTPANVNILFTVETETSNVKTPVPGLAESGNEVWKDNFEVTDGSGVLNAESSATIHPRTDLTSRIPTVLVLDISGSIGNDDYYAMIKGVRDSLITATFSAAEPAVPYSSDPNNPPEQPVSIEATGLIDGQEVAIVIFDSASSVHLDFTKDPQQIYAKFEEMLIDTFRSSRGSSSSTVLYKAIVQGMGLWEDSFTTTDVTEGFLVVSTDGENAPGSTTLSAVQAIRDADPTDRVRVFTIPMGSADNAALKQDVATYPNYGLATAKFADLGTEIKKVVGTITDVLNSLYVLDYTTPALSGSQTVTIKYKTGSDPAQYPQLMGSYSADNFTGAQAELDVLGSRNVIKAKSETFTVKTKYNSAINQEAYTWSVDGVEESTTGSLIFSEANYGKFSFVVTDTRNTVGVEDDLSTQFYVYVTDTEITGATKQISPGQTLSLKATSRAALTPSFTWTVDNTSNCTITGNGADATLNTKTYSFSVSETFYSCNVVVTDSANGSSQSIYTVQVGTPGTKVTLLNTNIVKVNFEDQTTGSLTMSGDWTAVATPLSGSSTLNGSYVYKAATITHSETSSMSFTASFTEISFDYLVSSEISDLGTLYDKVTISIDGTIQESDGGTAGGWESFSATVSEGEHVVVISYIKDGNSSDGEDTAYIDNISLL